MAFNNNNNNNQKLETELNQLRSNADSLAQCLDALLKRIEDLETISSANENHQQCRELSSSNDDDESQSVTVNVLRRVAAALSGGSSASGGVNGSASMEKAVMSTSSPIGNNLNGEGIMRLNDGNKNATVFHPRIVSISTKMLTELHIEFFAGEAIVLKVSHDAIAFVRPGDTILEISGQPVMNQKQFYAPFATEIVTLKLVPSNTYDLPMKFCKILDDYSANHPIDNNSQTVSDGSLNVTPSAICVVDAIAPNNSAQHQFPPCLSFNLKKGDVVQVISMEKTFMQARKVNDLSTSGFIPVNIKMEQVAMLSPYGRRVLVLLGANGVGRRKLKSMLIKKMPNHFATVIPVTSRQPKSGEVDGHNFKFVTKEEFLKLIRANQLIEWGEVNGYLYGTSADSVRQVIRSGRVCVVDCTEKALKLLYTREFMPYVVVIAAPSFDELYYLNECRTKLENRPSLTPQEIDGILEENEKLLYSPYAKLFHLVLINKNFDITLRRLIDALNRLKNEPQWIPLDWLS